MIKIKKKIGFLHFLKPIKSCKKQVFAGPSEQRNPAWFLRFWGEIFEKSWIFIDFDTPATLDFIWGKSAPSTNCEVFLQKKYEKKIRFLHVF